VVSGFPNGSYFSEMQSSGTLVSLLSFVAAVFGKKSCFYIIFEAICVFEFRLGDVCLHPKYKALHSNDYFLFGFTKVNNIQNQLGNLVFPFLILCYVVFLSYIYNYLILFIISLGKYDIISCYHPWESVHSS